MAFPVIILTPLVEDNRIPGLNKYLENGKIPGGCENFNEIPRVGRKKAGKFQGFVKILMEF